MPTLQEKVLAAMQPTGVVEHEVLVETLDYNERFHLLNTVRDMQKAGLLKRDIDEKRDGRRVLKYRKVTTGA